MCVLEMNMTSRIRLNRSLSASTWASGSIENRVAELFNKIDSNSDNILSREEVLAAAPDLGISRDEADSLFNILDVNSDGVIDRSEFNIKPISDNLRSPEGLRAFIGNITSAVAPPVTPNGRWSVGIDKFESAGQKGVYDHSA